MSIELAGGRDAGFHGTSVPSHTSAANGMRNFIDAASQTQKRTAAWFFRRAAAMTAAAPAQTVDCHR